MKYWPLRWKPKWMIERENTFETNDEWPIVGIDEIDNFYSDFLYDTKLPIPKEDYKIVINLANYAVRNKCKNTKVYKSNSTERHDLIISPFYKEIPIKKHRSSIKTFSDYHKWHERFFNELTDSVSIDLDIRDFTLFSCDWAKIDDFVLHGRWGRKTVFVKNNAKKIENVEIDFGLAIKLMCFLIEILEHQKQERQQTNKSKLLESFK